MKKIIILLALITILLCSVVAVSAGLFDNGEEEKLNELKIPSGFKDKSIDELQSRGKVVKAFKDNPPYSITVNCGENTGTDNLTKFSDIPAYCSDYHHFYEVVDIDGEKYCVSVLLMSTGTSHPSANDTMLDVANIFKEFNDLNNAKAVEIN